MYGRRKLNAPTPNKLLTGQDDDVICNNLFMYIIMVQEI